jgi:hypothetical protein
MVQPRFIVLNHVVKTPSVATCMRCLVKFYTPLDLIPHPEKALENLHDQFSKHVCKPPAPPAKDRNALAS